jgi:hypothetical protein
MAACNRRDKTAVRRESLLALSRVFRRFGEEQCDRADLIHDAQLATALTDCSTVLFALGNALEDSAHGAPAALASMGEDATARLCEEQYQTPVPDATVTATT